MIMILALIPTLALCSQYYYHSWCYYKSYNHTGVCANKQAFCASLGRTTQQQKLQSSPRYGAFKTGCPTCLLIRRSVFSQTPVGTPRETRNTTSRPLSLPTFTFRTNLLITLWGLDLGGSSRQPCGGRERSNRKIMFVIVIMNNGTMAVCQVELHGHPP